MKDAYIRHRENTITSLIGAHDSCKSNNTCNQEDACAIWEKFLRTTLCYTVDSQWRNYRNRMETLDSQLDRGARSKIADKINWFIDQDNLSHPIGVYKREAARIYFETMKAVSREVLTCVCHTHPKDIPHK